MKKIYFIFTLLSSFLAISQIPAGYYDTATGSGYTLKTQLKTIISSDNISLTSSGYSGLWSFYDTQLRDNFVEYDNDGSLFDIYSENPTGIDPYNFTSTAQQDTGNNCAEGGCYNREHLVPQSYFEKHALYPMRNDLHHVVPSDKYVNAQRANFPFGKVATATYTSQNGSKKGNNLDSGYSAGYSSTVFEPLDDFKGDVARSFFYFATRYEDNMDEFYSTTSTTTECKVMFDGSIDKVFSNTFLNILYTWHINDPVSNKEISFNNKIYTYQGNRNPYIDHPEYVAAIWGTSLANETFSDNIFNIYPNPSNGNFRIEYDTTIGDINVEVYSMIGQKVFEKQNVNNNAISTNGLQSGVYLVKIAKDSKSIVKKIVIN